MGQVEPLDNPEPTSNAEAFDPAVVELQPSVATEPTGRDSNRASQAEPGASDSSRVQTAVVSMSVGGIRLLASVGTAVAHHIASSRPVRYVTDTAGEISTALAEESDIDLRRAVDRAEEQVARLFAVVVPVVVDSIDPDEIVDRIGVNALIEKVDLDAVLKRVDLNAVLDSVDLDALLARLDLDELIERVDIDAVLNRVDLNAILDNVDLDALLARVDLDRHIERVDIDAVMARVDVAEISERIRIWNIVAKSTGTAAGSAVDSAKDLTREQRATLNVVIGRTIDRMRTQEPDESLETAPPNMKAEKESS